ncbi:MAG: hypothetical protein ACLFXM_07570 [Acidimicrobiia bacterium]
MRIRLEPEDDFLHPVEEATNFNESRYYNVFDRPSGLGGWVRMGNRPNEGYAEMTVCLYLPARSDDPAEERPRVAFMFKRPRIEGHEAHDAGGLRFEVVEPFARHRVTYDGSVCVLADPREMADPRAAFAANPHERCTIDLDLRAVGRPWGGEPEWEEGEQRPELDPERSFVRGHTEQHMAVTGTVTIGGETFELTDGLGLRDHSWGPRYWQSVWWYRWLTANLGRGLGFAATLTGREDDPDARRSHGFLYDVDRYGDDRWVPIRAVELDSDYDDEWFPRVVRARLTTDDHVYDVRGDVWSTIPLRNRRDGMVTRITEGMTTWRCGDLVGAGMSEYLDQVVDGVPVGTRAGI